MQKRLILIMVVLLITITTVFAQTAADFTVNANGVITKYSGFDTDIIIPATIGGKKITAIGDEAFQKAELTSVTIPDGVISIGQRAFTENKLTSITIPGSVKVIGQSAFWDNQLATIVLSEGLEEDHGAFGGNKANLTITLPSSLRVFNSVVGIEATAILAANINVAFSGCFLEREFWKEAIFYQYIANDRKAGTYTPDPVKPYDKREGDFNYIATPYGAILTRYNGNSTRVRIPAEIGGLKVKALYGTFDIKSIDAVQIPEGITYIGTETFSRSSLASVTLPEGITYIGDRAFLNNKLTSVTIPAGVTYIGNQAFAACQLASVTIPGNVVYIGDQAFMGNKLTAITIPAGVTYIGARAFMGIKTITLPSSVKTLGGAPIEDYVDAQSNRGNVEGSVIVIGANTDVNSNGYWGNVFKYDYEKNGRKAGRYTFTWGTTYGWVYSAR